MNTISNMSLQIGLLEDRDWFDPIFYADRYKDVAGYPLGLTLHYINHGMNEGRLPKEKSLIPSLRKVFTLFIQANVAFPFKKDDSVHFFQWMNAHANVLTSLNKVYTATDTSEEVLLKIFSETAYFNVSQSKLAQIHQRLSGLAALIALLTVASTEDEALGGLSEMLKSISYIIEREYDLVRRSGEFDEAFYLSAYEDVRLAGIDPLRHYLQHGYLEGRDPSSSFSTNFYLANNHDVKTDGTNPLLHFIVFGRGEGRTGKPARITLPLTTNNVESNPHVVELLGALHEVAENLDRYQAISFDFFDTLVERQIPDPHAVFSAMQQHDFIQSRSSSFRRLRVEAETQARTRGKPEITIAEIYEELVCISSFTRQDIPELIKLEQEYELATLSARPLGVDLLNKARVHGLNIVIASDFYIGEQFIRQVMRKVGISSNDIAILVSCDQQCTKHEGSMFALIEAELKIPANRILHVGDNRHSDHFMPLSKGLAAACIPPTKKAFPARTAIDFYVQPNREVETCNIYSSLAIHRSILPIVATPLAEAAEFGYKILGPVILAYCQFLKKIAKVQNVDNFVFLSRDTRVVYDAFDKLFGGDRVSCSTYILVSRQAIFGASAVDINAVRDIIARDYAELSFVDLLRDRFLFDDTELDSLFAKHPWLTKISYFDIKGPPSLTKEHFFTTAAQIFDSIKDVSDRRRRAYEAYLKTMLSDENKSLLVDIGYRGTTQIAFSRLFSRHMNSVYFMTWSEINMVAQHGLGAWAFAPDGSEMQRNLTKYVSMLELVFSDPNTSTLRYFEKKNNLITPIFGCNDLSQEQSAYLTEAHRAAIEFCEDARASANLISLTEVERAEICAPLLRFFEKPARHFKQTFRNAVFEDKFGGASQRLLGQGR